MINLGITFVNIATIFFDNFDENEDEDLWHLAAAYVDVHEPRRPRVFHDRSNPLTELDDDDFRIRYRLTKTSFVDLLEAIEPELRNVTESHGGLLPIHQLIVTLRFYASGSFLVGVFVVDGSSWVRFTWSPDMGVALEGVARKQ